MATNVKPIPSPYHALTPHLTVQGAERAVDFYCKAFGAEVLHSLPAPDGRIMHAELKIGDSMLMLADEFPNMDSKAPPTLGGTTVSLHLYVSDVDATFRRAISCGATERMAVQEMFWGDRYGKLRDPFGHDWAIATHVEDVPPEEMARRARQMFGK